MDDAGIERRMTEISTASYNMGAKHERERIIALLELHLDCKFTEYDYLGFRDHSEHCKACELVALIKGDNE